MGRYKKTTAMETCPECGLTEKMDVSIDTLAGVSCATCPKCNNQFEP